MITSNVASALFEAKQGGITRHNLNLIQDCILDSINHSNDSIIFRLKFTDNDCDYFLEYKDNVIGPVFIRSLNRVLTTLGYAVVPDIKNLKYTVRW